MTLLQQAMLKMPTMAFHDKALACKRACQQSAPMLG